MGGRRSGVIIVQIVAYTGWLASGDATPTTTGADAVPGMVKVWAWLLQVLGPVGTVAVIVYVVRRSRREGRLCFDALCLIAWFLVIWQDPGGLFLRTQTLYNSYLVNLGSWAPHIPGWSSPNAQKLPEPILFSLLMYASSGVLFAAAVCAVIRWCHRRRPNLSKVQIVGCGLLAGFVIDLVIEVFFVRTEIYQYTGAVQWLAIWGGARHQFPIYESLLWGSGVWGVIGTIRYLTDDRGRTIVERGADEVKASERPRTALRALAVTGLINCLFLAYNVEFAGLSLYGGPTPRDIPSYFRNDMCGAGTGYPCPSPGGPIPLKGHPIPGA